MFMQFVFLKFFVGTWEGATSVLISQHKEFLVSQREVKALKACSHKHVVKVSAMLHLIGRSISSFIFLEYLMKTCKETARSNA